MCEFQHCAGLDVDHVELGAEVSLERLTTGAKPGCCDQESEPKLAALGDQAVDIGGDERSRPLGLSVGERLAARTQVAPAFGFFGLPGGPHA